MLGEASTKGGIVRPAPRGEGKLGLQEPLPGEPFHRAGRGPWPSLVKAWLGFLLSASQRPRVCCILKIDANICRFPFVSGLFISLVHFFFPFSIFFLLLIFRKFPSC